MKKNGEFRSKYGNCFGARGYIIDFLVSALSLRFLSAGQFISDPITKYSIHDHLTKCVLLV